MLGLAGAPANVQLICDPAATDAFGVYGYADPNAGAAWLGHEGCAALLISAMTRRERTGTQRLNNIVLGWIQGEGLLVALHEARHLRGDLDECRVEAFAFAHVGELIDRFVPERERGFARQAAYMLHAALPGDYHGCDDA